MEVFPSVLFDGTPGSTLMKSIHSFWPLDFDQEVEIYENPSWDMPGRRRSRPASARKGNKDSRLVPAPRRAR